MREEILTFRVELVLHVTTRISQIFRRTRTRPWSVVNAGPEKEICSILVELFNHNIFLKVATVSIYRNHMFMRNYWYELFSRHVITDDLASSLLSSRAQQLDIVHYREVKEGL